MGKTKYTPEMCMKIKELKEKKTTPELAKYLGIKTTAFYKYIKLYKEFRRTIEEYEGRYKIGAPLKLTLVIQEEILKLIREGNYLETAAAFVGIDKRTLHDWLSKGAQEEEGIYVEFSHLVQKAQAEAIVSDNIEITTAGRKDWRAIAWRLERKNPKLYGKQEKVEHTLPEGIEINQNHKGKIEIENTLDFSNLSDEELRIIGKVIREPKKKS